MFKKIPQEYHLLYKVSMVKALGVPSFLMIYLIESSLNLNVFKHTLDMNLRKVSSQYAFLCTQFNKMGPALTLQMI